MLDRKENNICISVFCYENSLVYPVYISGEEFENCLNLLMITDKNKSHYVYVKKNSTDLCALRQKNKSKEYFCKH